jgi:hypothetical protein
MIFSNKFNMNQKVFVTIVLITTLLFYLAHYYANKVHFKLNYNDKSNIETSKNLYIAGLVFLGVGFVYCLFGLYIKKKNIIEGIFGLCLIFLPAILFMSAYLVVDNARKTANYNEQQYYISTSEKLSLAGEIIIAIPIIIISLPFIINSVDSL